MKDFSLLVKPASADCNLRCPYCFYLDKKSLYPESAVHRMADSVLEKMVSSFLGTTQTRYSFAWQGGEPLLMGPAFFRRVTELQVKHAPKGAIISNGVQTNGTLVSEELAAHFEAYRFLVGVSLDGPREIHDPFRYDGAGKGSHRRVFEGIEILRRFHVEFNVLSLIHAGNVRQGRKILKYFMDKGFNYLQFIPCVEFDAKGKPLPHTVTGENWGTFLCEVFDEWLKRGVGKVSIRLFDSIMAVLTAGASSSCQMDDDCRQYFVVEHNGDVYPCDFFVDQKFRLGNLENRTWADLLGAEEYRCFGLQKSQRASTCLKCDYLRFCSGDCLKYRQFLPESYPENKSWLCRGWQCFYSHALPEFKKLAGI